MICKYALSLINFSVRTQPAEEANIYSLLTRLGSLLMQIYSTLNQCFRMYVSLNTISTKYKQECEKTSHGQNPKLNNNKKPQKRLYKKSHTNFFTC